MDYYKRLQLMLDNPIGNSGGEDRNDEDIPPAASSGADVVQESDRVQFVQGQQITLKEFERLYSLFALQELTHVKILRDKAKVKVIPNDLGDNVDPPKESTGYITIVCEHHGASRKVETKRHHHAVSSIMTLGEMDDFSDDEDAGQESGPAKKCRNRGPSKRLGCKWRISARIDSGDWLQYLEQRKQDPLGAESLTTNILLTVVSVLANHTGGCSPTVETFLISQTSKTPVLVPSQISHVADVIDLLGGASSASTFLNNYIVKHFNRRLTSQQIYNMLTRIHSWRWGWSSMIETNGGSEILLEKFYSELPESTLPNFLQYVKMSDHQLPIDTLMQLLKSRIQGLDYRIGVNSADNSLEAIVLMTHRQRRRAIIYGEMISIDATYNRSTDRFQILMPCIITEHGNIFPIAYVLSKKDGNNNYSWLLKSIIEMCPEWKDVCKCVLSDQGFSHEVAEQEIGPGTRTIICFFHMEKNFNDTFRQLAEREAAWSMVKQMQESVTEDALESVIADFMGKFELVKFNHLRVYVNNLLQKRERWVRIWRDQVFNFGFVSSSVSESLNSSFKRYLYKCLSIQGLILTFLEYEHKNEAREKQAVIKWNATIRKGSSVFQAVNELISKLGTTAFLRLNLQLRMAQRVSMEFQSQPNSPAMQFYKCSMPSGLGTSTQSFAPLDPTYIYTVTHDISSKTLKCDCQQCTRWGLPCVFMLAVILRLLTIAGVATSTARSDAMTLLVSTISPRWLPNTMTSLQESSLDLNVLQICRNDVEHPLEVNNIGNNSWPDFGDGNSPPPARSSPPPELRNMIHAVVARSVKSKRDFRSIMIGLVDELLEFIPYNSEADVKNVIETVTNLCESYNPGRGGTLRTAYLGERVANSTYAPGQPPSAHPGPNSCNLFNGDHRNPSNGRTIVSSQKESKCSFCKDTNHNAGHCPAKIRLGKEIKWNDLNNFEVPSSFQMQHLPIYAVLNSIDDEAKNIQILSVDNQDPDKIYCFVYRDWYGSERDGCAIATGVISLKLVKQWVTKGTKRLFLFSNS